ncbi:hypothetical protein ACFL3H_00855 [Gemmatimonadota bacterium]
MRHYRYKTILILLIVSIAGCAGSLKGKDPQRDAIQKIVDTQRELQRLRSGILIFAAREQTVPEDIETLVENRILKKIPVVAISGSNRVVLGPLPENPTTDTGDWFYNPDTGEIRVGLTGPQGSVPVSSFLPTYTGTVDPWNDW